MNLNLYLISQDVNADYDTYDSAVVCAESEDAARRIHPATIPGAVGYSAWWKRPPFVSWAHPNDVRVELIGLNCGRRIPGVICASFNAG